MPPRLTGPTIGQRPDVDRSPDPNRAMMPGQVIAGAGRVVERLNQEIQRLDEIRVNEALADYTTGVDTLLNDPRDGILAKRGTKAIEGLDPFRDQLSVRRGDAEAKLGNARQRDLFRLQSERVVREADRRAVTYLDAETRRVDVENTDRLNAADLRTVTELAGNEAEVGKILTEMRNRMTLFGDRNQMEREQVASIVADMTEKARLSQIETLAGREDVETAGKVLASAIEAGQIRGENQEKARAFVERASLTVNAQRQADAIIAANPRDERAALAAARELTGALRDQVEARVERRFADERRLTQQAIESRAQSIAQRIEAGGALTTADEAWLAGQSPELARSLRKRAEQKAKGVPAVTDYQTLFELYSMTPEARRDVNPFEYQDKLDEGDFQWLLGEVAALRGGGKTTAEERGGYTPPQIDLMTFSRAREMGYIAGSVATMAGLKENAREAEKFDTIRKAVFAAINTARQNAGPNARLTKREIDEVVQGVLDDAVIENPSGLQGDRPMPRAAAPTGRTPTAADSVTFGIRPRAVRPSVSKADRWEQLVSEGATPEQATAQVNREMP